MESNDDDVPCPAAKAKPLCACPAAAKPSAKLRMRKGESEENFQVTVEAGINDVGCLCSYIDIVFEQWFVRAYGPF